MNETTLPSTYIARNGQTGLLLRTPPSLSVPATSRDVGSPVNQTGSFECDRVLKSGHVWKRKRRTKSWNPVRLILRPNLLSIYKDREETLRHQINLSEITAVALRRDRKGRKDHVGVFGLFTPSRNFHLEAETEGEAQEWVNLIRQESRIVDDEVILSSPRSTQRTHVGFGTHFQPLDDVLGVPVLGDTIGSSINSGVDSGTSVIPMAQAITIPARRQHVDLADLSGNEAGSYSDFSDAPIFGSAHDISISIQQRTYPTIISSESAPRTTVQGSSTVDGAPFYKLQPPSSDEERVVWHGFLLCRRSQGSVRQWKRFWVVLRPKHLALYKNEEEYAALLIIPLSSVIDAVDTDPVSKSKAFCMQVITDERSYRFCASGEDDLSNWVGRIKSVLTKRREALAQQKV